MYLGDLSETGSERVARPQFARIALLDRCAFTFHIRGNKFSSIPQLVISTAYIGCQQIRRKKFNQFECVSWTDSTGDVSISSDCSNILYRPWLEILEREKEELKQRVLDKLLILFLLPELVELADSLGS